MMRRRARLRYATSEPILEISTRVVRPKREEWQRIALGMHCALRSGLILYRLDPYIMSVEVPEEHTSWYT